jgi:hypothetical protein
MFITQILERFTGLDIEEVHHQIITMNTRNIGNIRLRCDRHSIHILPISHHITLQTIQDNTLMRAVFNGFINSFNEKIRDLAPESSYPDITIGETEDNKTQYIIRDLMLIVPYNIIQARFRVSKGYIAGLASYIRSFNYPLPDRRKKDWRLQWEIQE